MDNSSTPLCIGVWKMINDPVIDLYQNLNQSAAGLEVLIKSIVNSCKISTHVFVPPADSSNRGQEVHYIDFIKWLLGRLFYLSASDQLVDIIQKSVDAQVKILRMVGTYSMNMFDTMITEYLHCLADILEVQMRPFPSVGKPVYMSRFVPSPNSLLNSHLNLSQYSAEISSSDSVCCRFQITALQVLLDTVTTILYCPEISSRAWSTTLSLICNAPYTVKAEALKFVSGLLAEDAFFMVPDFQLMFCDCLHNLVSSVLEERENFNMDVEEERKMEDSLMVLIKVLSEVHSTESVRDNTELLATMTMILLKWRTTSSSEEILISAAKFARVLLDKTPNIHVENGLAEQIVQKLEKSLAGFCLLECLIVKELVVHLANLESSESGMSVDEEAEVSRDNRARNHNIILCVRSGSPTWACILHKLNGQEHESINLPLLKEAVSSAASVIMRMQKYDTPYTFIFFDRELEKLLQYVLNLLGNLDLSKEAAVNIVNNVLMLTGTLMRLPEVEQNVLYMETLVAIISLPWLHKSPLWNNMQTINNDAILSLPNKFCISFATKVKLFCLEQLSYLEQDRKLDSWRWELTKQLMTDDDQQVVARVIELASYYVLSGLSSAQDVLGEILDNGSSRKNNELAISKALPSFVCAFAGNSVCIREMIEGQVKFKQVCTVCDAEGAYCNVKKNTHSLEGIDSVVMQLMKSSAVEVRQNVVKCLPRLSNHAACSADMLPSWLNLLCDKERSVRVTLQDKIPCLAFSSCWMKKRKMQQHLPLSLQDRTELKRASSILRSCVAQLWQMMERSLGQHDGDLQETLLGTVKHFGCMPVDTVILPSLSLLLLAISHPSCLLKPMARYYVEAVAAAHHASPNDLYVRFKRELCRVIVDFMLMNHYRGDTTSIPSMQKVVQALEIPSWKDFIIMDMHYILPPLIAAIGKDKDLQPLLDVVANTADVETAKLVDDHFQYIYPYLCLNESAEVKANCLKYLEQLTGLSISTLRTHSFKGIHNELLLHFEQNKECVLSVLCELAQDDLHYRSLRQPLTNSQIADFLQPRFLGLLVYLDGKLVNKKVSESIKKKALLSLPEIIKFLGPRHITPVRFKVLATLRTALELNYSNFPDLNCAAWDAFVHSVDVPMLGPLLSTVFISLLPLLEQFAQEISNIFSFLVVDNYDTLCPYFKELYFVPQHEAIPAVYKEIQKYLQEKRPPTLRDQLEEMMGYVKHENAGVRVQGLYHLKTLLQENRSALHALVVGREQVDPIVMEVLNALVALRREADFAVRLACSECIGEIGAVDPGNLPRCSYQDESKCFPFKVTDDEFAVLALSHLARAVQSARDTQTMDSFSLAIQELLKVYGISSQPGSTKEKLWKSFPEDIREIMTPLLTSCYKNTLNPSQSWPHPIFGSNDKMTLQAWASDWSYKMITMIDDSKVRAVFEACLVSLKRDLATLQFFLPYILLHTLLCCSVTQKQQLLEEMLHVMNVPISEQEEIFSLDSPAIVDRKDTATVAHITCTKTVFTLIDFLLRWLREWSRKYGASQDAAVQEYATVQEFVKQIPTLSVAQSNYQCEEYPRSLMYLELYVKEFPDLFQQQHWMFMKIYARLDESDAVTGIMACRVQEPSLEEMILAHQMTGQFQDAAVCYERLFQEQGLTPNFLKGMVQCYLNLDQPFTALRIAEGFVSERPDLASTMTDAEAEALWRMQMYDELTDLYEEFPELTERKLWGVKVGKAMLNFKGGFQQGLESNIMDLRSIVMDSLGNISVEKGTYQLGYSNIIKLHMMSEIEMAEKLVGNILKQEQETECKVLVQNQVNSWNERLQFVQQNSQAKEPILCLRRVLLELAKKRVEPQFPSLGQLLDQEVGKCWLQSAVLARKDGIYQQAYTYILNAEKYHLKELFVEKARLYWVKGEQEPAFSTLRRGLEEHFSELDLSKASLTDRKLCAEAKLLFATYNDETVNVDVDQNISNYKEAVEVCKEWEKSMVCLAQYYDRVFNSMADEEKDTKGGDMQVHMIKYFGKSLYYGCNFIYQSMPRLLSIWLDFGSRFMAHSTPPQEIAQNMAKMIKLIDTLVDQLPSYMFLTAFSQLTSRICHPHPEVYKQLKNIITKMIVNHTQHAMWMFMSIYKSSYSLRCKRCQDILSSKPIKLNGLTKLVADFSSLAEKLIELTNKHLPMDVTSARINEVLSSFPRLLTSPNFSSILMPVQKFCTLQLPVDMKKLQDHIPFSRDPVYITGIAERMYILPSLQRPRRIALKGSDGKEYMIMCKAKDDLRKDFRLMEFNNIVNRYLRKDPDSRQRGLHIRTYSVVPLNEECGLIEWVPNLVGLRPILLQLYKEKRIYTSGRELKNMMCNNSDSLSKKRSVFTKQLLPKHPPVFDEWFRLTFPDPYGWYQARTSYIRTTAVMSMVGYILGLGDRHGENILFDSTNGDTVHVDFNCLFNKGENFEWAERVPFRLTHNMVAGMGPMGVEGVFRRSCEITLRVLRSQIETLMSVLRPFVYDPMVSWHQNQQQGTNYYTAHRKDIEITNDMAVKNLRDIELRLQGMVRTKGKSCSLSLSVEGQANNLILEATNIDNLCQMYIGWGPFL